MNKIKYFFYWLTHPILCIFGWHKLICWDKDTNDYQCWCCESDGELFK